jgi:uncharacterized repeat protein (TIGR03806 family)
MDYPWWMPIARRTKGAVFVLFSALGACAADDTHAPTGGAGPFFDAAVEAALPDLVTQDSALDSRGTGLDQRPRNATCRAPQTPEDMPVFLRDTGCFDSSDLRKPTAGLIPYSVKAPLWSDRAAKERYLALPDEAKIRVESDGDFDLPIGTVLVKTFVLEDLVVETRLFVRHATAMWAGYSYEWNEAGTDAVLLGEDSVFRMVRGQEWQFPSRQHCLDCHTSAAGFVLGLEWAQLDRDFTYPNGRTANQLATFAAIDLFEDAPPIDAVPTMPSPDDALAPIEQRARAYLHANCGNCHRPHGVSEPNVTIDLRFTTALEAASICNEPPRRTDLGIADVKLLAPGDPTKSMISFRMRSLVPSLRMPPMASTVPDEEGAGLLDAWIQAISSCP